METCSVGSCSSFFIDEPPYEVPVLTTLSSFKTISFGSCSSLGSLFFDEPPCEVPVMADASSFEEPVISSVHGASFETGSSDIRDLFSQVESGISLDIYEEHYLEEMQYSPPYGAHAS